MKILKIVFGAFLFLVCFSCEDLLTEVPRDRTTVENFFQTPENLDETITATYKQLVFDTWNRGIGGARYRTIFCGADDWTTQAGGNKQDFKEGDQLAMNSSNQRTSAAGWDLPYDVILQANFSIEGFATLVEMGFSEEELKSKVAEVYFLRAWAYFTLVRLYGGVPLNLKANNSPEDFIVPRSSEEEVYDLILSDLAFAIEHLPQTQQERARVSQLAAKALRSTVYLTMASWPLKQTDKYSSAILDAQEVINSGVYAFENEFSSMFLRENEDINTEYIWQLKFCGDADCPNQGLNTPYASQTTKPLELAGFDDLFIELSFFNKFPEGARKDHTFLSYLLQQNGDTLFWPNFNFKHPYMSKFYDGAVDKTQPYESQVGSTAVNADLDFPMLRITEMMLVYAEANAMGGGGDNGIALDYLNRVRRRAKGVDVNSPDADDLVSFTRQDVIDERGWEFVGECKRWYDLIRTETLADALSDRDSDDLPLIGDPANQNLYYHPIPDLDLQNNPLLTQNPR